MDTSTFWSDHFSQAVINNLRDIVNGSGTGSGIIDNPPVPTNSDPLPVPDNGGSPSLPTNGGGTPSYIVPVKPTINDMGSGGSDSTQKKISQPLPIYDFFNTEYFSWSIIAIFGGGLFAIAMLCCAFWQAARNLLIMSKL